jgi:hypothetical protein
MRRCEEVDLDLSADQLGWLDTEVDYIRKSKEGLIRLVFPDYPCETEQSLRP